MTLQNSFNKHIAEQDDSYIFGSIANPVIAVDHRGRITIFNHGCEKLFGLTYDQVSGKLVSEIIPYTGLIKVLKTGKAHIGRKFVLGNALYVANRTPIIRNGSIVGAIGVIQEITELHHMAEELKQVTRQKKVLESIFKNTNEGYISINSEGYINFVNNAMAELLSLSPMDILGKHITEIVPESKTYLIQFNGRSEQNQITYIGDKKALVSRYPVIENGKVEGAVSKVVYQDLDKLASMLTKNKQVKTNTNMPGAHYSLSQIIGNGKSITKLKDIVRRVARGPSTVLITGESGTGKELFAHAVHSHSPRSNGPFIKVNCAAVPENLLESELFGYQDGAFTGAKKGGQIGKFELANGGTIFLDEIGDMPLAMQAKILRVLQEKEIERLGGHNTKKVNVRIIAATNRDLTEMIDSGKFRQDLYYRLNVVNLNIPPLRERKEDIGNLVKHFIEKFNQAFNIQVTGCSEEVLNIFMGYHWPGNVREMENIIERAFNLVDGQVIEPEHLPHYLLKQKETFRQPLTEKALPALLENVEREALLEALEKTGGNKLQAAKLLGISRAWLYKKIKQYQIDH
ncbi:sigma-54 interaction domain-containing protein [Desulfallas thermosapovorans]|uniref:PAS domain S-box-containing protein n=1 Tax=Desulfallas thermosapovorans DSM 6562 TaxID=1121431 RepID=A0A5S4ZTG1_9FIRM|nr:sigma-54-dependent Fis family transcriptional regulator [Desulfallas thermosapovorans]TYO96245.1 PAS domain S-box-containing protein [Desulfallas thermosapovorans DSM 6562]